MCVHTVAKQISQDRQSCGVKYLVQDMAEHNSLNTEGIFQDLPNVSLV